MEAKALRPTPISSARPIIDLYTALHSTIRVWLAIRDQALVAFMAGTNPENRLEVPKVDTPEMAGYIARLGELRTLCLQFAEQLAVKGESAEEVLSRGIDAVLEAESPMFLLRAESIPGSF
jgi:hypothetical protein